MWPRDAATKKPLCANPAVNRRLRHGDDRDLLYETVLTLRNGRCKSAAFVCKSEKDVLQRILGCSMSEMQSGCLGVSGPFCQNLVGAVTRLACTCACTHANPDWDISCNATSCPKAVQGNGARTCRKCLSRVESKRSFSWLLHSRLTPAHHSSSAFLP